MWRGEGGGIRYAGIMNRLSGKKILKALLPPGWVGERERTGEGESKEGEREGRREKGSERVGREGDREGEIGRGSRALKVGTLKWD